MLKDASVNGRILELNNTNYTLDPYHDRLVSVGFDVIDAMNYADGLALAHTHRPDLIIVHDDPSAGIDAMVWLEMQHNDRQAWLATTPLLILADTNRASELRIHELTDRVVTVLRRSDTLNQVTRTVKQMLNANRWG
jgi:response regulator RpfG family c-di-GMP phosphodiesterase